MLFGVVACSWSSFSLFGVLLLFKRNLLIVVACCVFGCSFFVVDLALLLL